MLIVKTFPPAIRSEIDPVLAGVATGLALLFPVESRGDDIAIRKGASGERRLMDEASPDEAGFP
jgi:hypothetical protein